MIYGRSPGQPRVASDGGAESGACHARALHWSEAAAAAGKRV